MTDYQKMYTTLFNAVTDALKKMEVQNYGDAKELLISAQQKTEEIYITAQNCDRSNSERGERSNAAPSEATAGKIIQKGGARPLPFGR